MKLKIMKLPNFSSKCSLPRYATEHSVGLDLQAVDDYVIACGKSALISTGLAIEIERGYEGQIRPRSGLAVQHGVTVLNAPGTIDSDYRGEIKVALINHGSKPHRVRIGDRVAQLVIAPTVMAEIELVHELSDTPRGAGGFGSTGS